MRRLTFLSTLVLSSALAAQTVTSPKGYADIEGVSCSSHPFTQPRYVQIHTDLKGKALAIKSIIHRQDGQCTSDGAKNIELEIVLAHSDASAASKTFANNYKTPAQVVFTKKKLSTPNWKAPTQAPHPWDFKLMFDKPFAYDGKQDLLWESRLHNPKNSANLWSDYHFTLSSKRNVASWKRNGTGCTATGRSTPMLHRSLVRTQISGGNPTLVFWTRTDNAPANAPSVTLIGLANPNAPVAGLCTRLFSDALAAVEATANPTGRFETPSSTTAPFDSSWVGTKLYTQGASVDAGRSDPIKVSASNGLEITLKGLSPDVKMVRILGFTSATQKDGLLVTNTGVVVTQFGI